MKKKVMIIFGTRPEAIKLLPLVRCMEQSTVFEPTVVITAQHRDMLDQVLALFEIKPHVDLDIMKPDQTLEDVTTAVLQKISAVIKDGEPDLVLVQGDTTTTMASALAAFYNKRPIGHVEAGLRSFDVRNPFPEEVNRRITSQVAQFHFAPTEKARQNLLAENVPEERVFRVGNTVVDALHWIRAQDYAFNHPVLQMVCSSQMKMVLVTAHRRENFGLPLENICNALRRLSVEQGVNIVFPVHPNPRVRYTVHAKLGDRKNIFLTEPLDYLQFVYLMGRAHLILTDSGGVQEEAPSFGVPVLVLRRATERPEAIEAGTARLVGTDEIEIYEEATRLLTDEEAYQAMSGQENPFGDGTACTQIVDILEKHVGEF